MGLRCGVVLSCAFQAPVWDSKEGPAGALSLGEEAR